MLRTLFNCAAAAYGQMRAHDLWIVETALRGAPLGRPLLLSSPR